MNPEEILNTENEVIENTDIDAENGGADEADAGGDDKEYSKDEVTSIIKNRLGRYAAKNAELTRELDTAKSEAKGFGAIKRALAKGGITGETEQMEYLANAFGITPADFKAEKHEPTRADAYIDARQFVKSASDDEIADEYAALTAKSKNRPGGLSEADRVRLSEITDRYTDIKFREDMNDAQKFCTQNKIDFNKLLKDGEFSEFVKDLNIPVSKAVRKFVKLKGNAGEKNTSAPVSTGSARDNGGSTAKDFYSRDEVAKMSYEELSKNMDVIHKSMKNW